MTYDLGDRYAFSNLPYVAFSLPLNFTFILLGKFLRSLICFRDLDERLLVFTTY